MCIPLLKLSFYRVIGKNRAAEFEAVICIGRESVEEESVEVESVEEEGRVECRRVGERRVECSRV